MKNENNHPTLLYHKYRSQWFICFIVIDDWFVGIRHETLSFFFKYEMKKLWCSNKLQSSDVKTKSSEKVRPPPSTPCDRENAASVYSYLPSLGERR